MMKKLLALTLLLNGCGYAGRGTQMIGQVKKVAHLTPLICNDYDSADISLGVMRNGVGSMSHEDNDVYISNPDHLKLLKSANEDGMIVKITYDKRRLAFCVPERWVTAVEVLR